MKTSGTYIDRLLFNILPLTLTIGFIIYVIEDQDIKTFINISLGVSLVFWIIDTTTMALKKTKPLFIKESIYIGRKKIKIENIIRINPRQDKRLNWDFRTIDFEVLNNGKIEKYRIIPKPIFFINDILGHKSKTIKILTDKFPELKDRISEEEIY